jgi:hypothetical protein
VTYRERQRLADIQAAIDATRSHLQRGDLSDGGRRGDLLVDAKFASQFVALGAGASGACGGQRGQSGYGRGHGGGRSTNDWLMVSTSRTTSAREASSERESPVKPMTVASAACGNCTFASADVAYLRRLKHTTTSSAITSGMRSSGRLTRPSMTTTLAGTTAGQCRSSVRTHTTCGRRPGSGDGLAPAPRRRVAARRPRQGSAASRSRLRSPARLSGTRPLINFRRIAVNHRWPVLSAHRPDFPITGSPRRRWVWRAAPPT